VADRSHPPSFPPAHATARPDIDPSRPQRPPGFRGAPARRRRSTGWPLGVLGIVALVIGALQLTGLAPWAQADQGATALDGKLERSIERAITAAAEDGVDLTVTSGLRSVAEQRVLWDEALETYGSEREAARWVLPPELSAHVQGLAVDVGPAAGAAWLADHGARWGLCQIFANEPWHFERATKNKGTCPELLPDASVLLDR